MLLGCALLLPLACPVKADDYYFKHSYTGGTTTKTLTNVDGELFPEAVKKPRVMPNASKNKKAAAKSASAKKKAARKPATPKVAKATPSSPPVISGHTTVKRVGDTLKIHTHNPSNDNVLPAPEFKYTYEQPEIPYEGDTWAFATFDAKKRSPRYVRCFGMYTAPDGSLTRGWHNVDINPLILQYARECGVDPLLIEIIIRHESNFNPLAQSPVGACGLMQLMPDTAAGYGITDIFDVRNNIRAGTRYISYQLEQFNSVPLALAAYNAGPGAVINYGGVPPYAETQYYVNTIYGEYQAGVRYRAKNR